MLSDRGYVQEGPCSDSEGSRAQEARCQEGNTCLVPSIPNMILTVVSLFPGGQEEMDC